MHKRVSIAATILVILVIVGITVGACSGSNTPSAPSGTTGSGTTGGAGTTGRGASAGGTGTLSIRLTDSPFTDAQALLVTFSEVSVHMADPGDWKMLPLQSGPGTVRTCDLTQLTHATDVLGVGPLAPGKYTQIRLTVQSATLYFGPNASTGSACAPTPPVGDTSAPVDIPSGEVKLNQEFTVPQGGATTITLDLNADQSVHETGGGNGHGNSSTKYIMSPVIGVVSVE